MCIRVVAVLFAVAYTAVVDGRLDSQPRQGVAVYAALAPGEPKGDIRLIIHNNTERNERLTHAHAGESLDVEVRKDGKLLNPDPIHYRHSFPPLEVDVESRSAIVSTVNLEKALVKPIPQGWIDVTLVYKPLGRQKGETDPKVLSKNKPLTTRLRLHWEGSDWDMMGIAR